MCGIIGYIGINEHSGAYSREQFVREAFIIDTLRGFDSTGLIGVSDDFETSVLKKLGPGYKFIESKAFKDMPLSDMWALIGHNRSATKGKVTQKNAHPFTFGPIRLVHNGTLSNMGRNLPHKPEGWDVDSAVIAMNLAEVPPEEAPEMIGHIQGAYVLVWTDERDKSINFVRNLQRPLHFAYNTGQTCMWFMSDGLHLEMLRKRRQTDIGQIYEFSEHTILKYQKGSLKPHVRDIVRPKVSSASRTSARPTTSSAKPITSRRNWQGTQGTRGWRSNRQDSPRSVEFFNRISLNGRTIPIPSALTDTLKKEYDLSHDDEVEFQVKAWGKYSGETNMGYATGVMTHPYWTIEANCIIHNVHGDAMKKMHQPWTINIIGVTGADWESADTLAFFGRIVNFDWDPKEDEVPDIKEDNEDTSSVYGPFGRLISLDEFYQKTKQGCANCQRDLYPHEHEEITWYGSMEENPLCDSCADYLTCSRQPVD